MDTTDLLWHAPPVHLTLPANEVHVWRASLEASEGDMNILRGCLIAEETERARRFYFERDRRRWTVARAVLRILLGRYLGTEPYEPRFITNEYGKPLLTGPLAEKHLCFNISHSDTLALYAFSYNREIGVDVEYMRPGIEHSELAAYHFSAREGATLRALPADLQEEAFFLCWSRKEAYIKARGMGLSLPLDQFDVSLTPGEPAALLASREDPLATEHWSLHALAPGERYAGALVVEGSDWDLHCWQWQTGMADRKPLFQR